MPSETQTRPRLVSDPTDEDAPQQLHDAAQATCLPFRDRPENPAHFDRDVPHRCAASPRALRSTPRQWRRAVRRYGCTPVGKARQDGAPSYLGLLKTAPAVPDWPNPANRTGIARYPTDRKSVVEGKGAACGGGR